MEPIKNLAHDLFQIYLLYSKKNLLKIDAGAPEGFNRSHCEVLLLLDDLGELPMSTVARMLSYSKAYITAIADFLHVKGMLNRIPGTEDRRMIFISLSESGKAFVGAHREKVESVFEIRLDPLTPDEMEQLSAAAADTLRILSRLPDSEDITTPLITTERRNVMIQPTTKYFPVLIENEDTIPEEFVQEVKPLLQKIAFPYCVHIPGYTSSNVKYPDWLILLDHETLHVLKHVNGERSAQQLPLAKICYMERGCILLNSWLEITAADFGNPTMRIEFNTTREDLMQPIVDRIRAVYSPIAAEVEKSDSALSFLKNADLRFYNYAMAALQPGNHYRSVVFQPAIAKSVLQFFKKSLLDAHLTLINQNELVDIIEAGHTDAAGNRNIGAIWRFIPRKSILTRQLHDHRDPETVELALELESGKKFSSIYTPDHRTPLEAFVR